MEEQKKPSVFGKIRKFIVGVIQGILIGAGAILPGISGGVLCVVFGIYRQMMAVLAHPFKNLKLYWKMFMPIGIGWAIGFIGLAGAVAKLLSINGSVVVSLFVGLIFGTFPGLFREGSKNGKSKGMYIALAISTNILLAFFYYLKFASQTLIIPSFGWYVFCGALWGISLIVPGMSSSSLLMFLGLYQPMSEGIATLNFNVLIPFAIGIIGTVFLLARMVNNLFDKHYGIAFFCVVGFVIASTIPIINLSFSSFGEAVLSLLALEAGFIGAYMMDRWSEKHPAQEDSTEEVISEAVEEKIEDVIDSLKKED